MRFHRLQNVQIALDYLKRRQVKLVNIRNDDITDGNPKLTLGLIWTIILHFQISEIHVTGESEDMTAKERLLLWSKQMTDGYVGVRCDNFTTSWRDGRLFNAIIHKYRPDLIDMSRVSTQTNRSNLENAFCVAEQLGVARLLDPEDVDVQAPDEKSVITYVSTLYDAFPKVPAGVDGISPNDVDIKWVEYQNMIKYLSQWIKHNVAMMSDRSFPNNPVELKALYTQYLQFKENEIPLKENEKTKIKNLYKMLEVWIEFGRIHLPPGHHPNDVEKEWGKLIVAMLEREKCLRPEVERLEMLQQIANRVQRDCVNGDDKLTLARIALQSDAKRLESGIQFLHEAEIAGYLLECENILRQQVMDIQLLLDGKFPFADQLVQRVSKLRDDLLSLRAECSSVYSKGRTLTTEQTKIMISGITQSLNSGFSQNFGTNLTPALTPAITPGGLSTPGSTFTSSLTPSLTPALTPGLQPSSVQSYMGSGGVMDPGSLRQLKHMQIRKPLQKSSLADSNMTEEEVNMKYVQDLLVWVEEMQVQLDRSEWGSDLPSVETHLETHKSVQRAIEEFQISLKDARLSEIQMTIPLKLTYSDKLNKLEKQYERLLSCSRERQSNLESLYDFVSHATQELIWLNEKEEEEVAFDWSDRNSNVSKKRDYHAELMMELEEKEEAIKSVQDKAERLMFKNHPAKITIEAYRAAMQTQWSWILQLCSCVEQHLKENAVYFEFFSDAKESMDYLRNLQESIQRKYSCDRSSSLHRLEDLIQESMDEKEQLLQYRSTVAGLVGRAKNIVQLRPRNPESPVRSSLPVKAICDYRQIEITIYKDDECILANNSHRAKWKVINPAGNEAMVPSVCFTVPPPNKEAVEKATRTEQLYQDVLALWHHSHINMKSVVSWHYLMADIRAIRNWNVASIKTMLPGEHQQVLSNLQSHFDEFLDDSKESEVFTLADRTQLERDVAACKEYYQELLRSAEREEHEELVYNNYISEIRNFRMHLEAHEEHLIRQIRTPLERDDLEQSLQRITEHGRKTAELNKLKEDLDVMKEKCELFLRQAAVSPSVPTLSSELTVLIQSMSQVYSMSSIYMDKLKTVSLVVKHSQSAEALVKFYESKLYVEDAMNSDVKSIETVISTLKQWRTEIDEKQEVFHDMEDELKRARLISDRMFKAHNERDFDLDWHKEKADQLSERWQNIHSQIDSRLRDLDGINKSLKNYRDTYSCLDEWVREMEAAQLKAQENKPEDSKALAELLNKQKVLVAEIEQKQSRIDECQKYSEQYSSAIKDYELQLMTFSAMVDSQHKSPLKKRRMQSSSDAIQQEFMDLRTRYTALVTLMTQYVKFASETLKRTEDEERSVDEEKREHGDKVSKLLHWTKQTLNTDGNAVKDSNANTDASNKPQVSVEEMVTKKEQIAEALRATQMMLNKHSDRMTEEEREKAQEQLKSLNQAFSELSQQCLDQTTSAEESLLEKHKEFTEKLEEMCDNLTLTENRLIGHQQQTESAESVTDLQQYQHEHQALQKDVLTNASALNEVIASTKNFLEENRNKLMPDQIAIIESKLEEAKSKAKLINQRAEESRKDLEKVVTTAIKQESEKAAAVERLEESKNKIEGLLDWISNIGSEKESGLDQSDPLSNENGNLPEQTSTKGLIGENDDANGNALETTENDSGRETRGSKDASMDLNKQYDRVKAHHQEILSQQQDLIMATQSAQALLERQANVLSPEEKDKLQKNIQELKGRYEASLTQAEQQMKHVQCVQEELKKFQDDCEEFEGWLNQSEGEIQGLGAPAASLNILSDKLQRQKSFSEDVISHKGDLRFITISGQKVLDVAKACGMGDPAAKNPLLDVDTSGTCSTVKDKLDSAASRYKALHSQCNQLGNNLKDVVDKYKKYDDSSAGLLKWLNISEEEARKQQSDAIAAEPQTLQKQLEETKALQGQMTGHQTSVDTLRKIAESLITSEGDLLSNPEEIQETVGEGGEKK
uniref:dystonin-like isoform X4 n=1 Tax=Solea senegalensis TaxID=28829 RepID=UPI001CD8CDFA|nr:dystonin-like isoform X4 [Solea senegalensis]